MMKEHMKRFCDEYDASRTDLDQWIDDLKGLPCDSMRLDRLQDSLPLYADLLKAVAADYPEAVQIWCGKDGGWGTTVTPGAQLSPRDVHRIKPGWTVPDKPDEDMNSIREWTDKYSVDWDGVLAQVQQWRTAPLNKMRFDRLDGKDADFLRAVAAEYPSALDRWFEGGWVDGSHLFGPIAHRIRPTWSLPDKPDEPHESDDMKATLIVETCADGNKYYWELRSISGQQPPVTMYVLFNYTTERSARQAGRRWAKKHNIEIVEIR